jgi:hypothetical protein
MKRVVKITESDINRIVKMVINETVQFTDWVKLTDANIPKFKMTTQDGTDVLGSVDITNTNTVVAYLRPGKYKPNELINVEISINSAFDLKDNIKQKTPMNRPVLNQNQITFSFKMGRTNFISKQLAKVDVFADDVVDKKRAENYGEVKANFSVKCKNIVEGEINFLVKGSVKDEVIVKR